METTLEMLSNFKGFDPNQHAFGILDEVTDNFQDRFREAQSKSKQAEKISIEKKKKTNDRRSYESSWQSQDRSIRFADRSKEVNTHLNKDKSRQKSRAGKVLQNRQQRTEKQRSSNTETKSSDPNLSKNTPQNISNNDSDRLMASMKNITIDSNESARILESLQNIAKMTQVKAPNYEKVSSKLINVLKSADGKGFKSPMTSRNALSLNSSEKDLSTEKSRSPNKSPLLNRNLNYLEKMQLMKSKALEQIRFQLQMAVRKGAQFAKIQLKPQFLGNVQVQLLIENSSATANFLVENNTVKELLQENISDLYESLREQGIEVEDIDVSVTDHDDASESSGNAFNSIEDRQTLKEWINSFYRYDKENAVASILEDESGDDEEILSESEELLNIIA